MQLDDLMFKPGLLRGQRILITGGGGGLGRVMAEACVMLGAEVYICGRRGNLLEEAATEMMKAHGGKVFPIVCDIRQPEAITQMLDHIWADGGALTSLINNAAGNFISRTEDLSPRAFDAVANIVFRGSFYVTLECGKRWLAQGKKGNVLSMLVTWIYNGSAFAVPSAMSKAGLHAMTQSLAVEWGNRGIRVNAIAPGFFPTESAMARLDPKGGNNPLDGIPQHRPGTMVELANAMIYLLSPGSEYVNGETLIIDGGLFPAVGGNFSSLAKWGDDDWKRARALIDERNAADRAQRST